MVAESAWPGWCLSQELRSFLQTGKPAGDGPARYAAFGRRNHHSLRPPRRLPDIP